MYRVAFFDGKQVRAVQARSASRAAKQVKKFAGKRVSRAEIEAAIRALGYWEARLGSGHVEVEYDR